MYNPQDLAIYIHWPFCKSKCPYCDFYKEVNPRVNQDDIVAEYEDALQKYQELLPQRTIKSIFFGGGTPSLLTPQNVAKIIDKIIGLWSIADNIEISLEANPNTHYQTMFKDLKLAGINRLSLGVQSLNDDNLRFLGRTHNAATAKMCLEEIVKTFSNHSADLIYALQLQKTSEWGKELEALMAYKLKHISLYQLTIEPNTVFFKHGIKAMDTEKAADLYNFTRDYLNDKGYEHYEVSNFAVKGCQSVHNLTYWQGGDYIGIGKSAHGRIFLNGKHYAAEYPFKHIALTAKERAVELLLMGLRVKSGIDKNIFKQICGLDLLDVINVEKLQYMKENSLLTENITHLSATYNGFLLLDAITSELII